MIYIIIFLRVRKIKTGSIFKMIFDSNNYLTIDIKNIYYYSIGNEHTNIDLKEIIRYLNVYLKEF